MNNRGLFTVPGWEAGFLAYYLNKLVAEHEIENSDAPIVVETTRGPYGTLAIRIKDTLPPRNTLAWRRVSRECNPRPYPNCPNTQFDLLAANVMGGSGIIRLIRSDEENPGYEISQTYSSNQNENDQKVARQILKHGERNGLSISRGWSSGFALSHGNDGLSNLTYLLGCFDHPIILNGTLVKPTYGPPIVATIDGKKRVIRRYQSDDYRDHSTGNLYVRVGFTVSGKVILGDARDQERKHQIIAPVMEDGDEMTPLQTNRDWHRWADLRMDSKIEWDQNTENPPVHLAAKIRYMQHKNNTEYWPTRGLENVRYGEAGITSAEALDRVNKGIKASRLFRMATSGKIYYEVVNHRNHIGYKVLNIHQDTPKRRTLASVKQYIRDKGYLRAWDGDKILVNELDLTETTIEEMGLDPNTVVRTSEIEIVKQETIPATYRIIGAGPKVHSMLHDGFRPITTREIERLLNLGVPVLAIGPAPNPNHQNKEAVEYQAYWPELKDKLEENNWLVIDTRTPFGQNVGDPNLIEEIKDLPVVQFDYDDPGRIAQFVLDPTVGIPEFYIKNIAINAPQNYHSVDRDYRRFRDLLPKELNDQFDKFHHKLQNDRFNERPTYNLNGISALQKLVNQRNLSEGDGGEAKAKVLLRPLVYYLFSNAATPFAQKMGEIQAFKREGNNDFMRSLWMGDLVRERAIYGTWNLEDFKKRVEFDDENLTAIIKL